MIGDVLPLLQTLFDIIRLKKGPDAIPYSPVLLTFIVAAWFGVQLLFELVVEPEFIAADFFRNMVVAFIGIAVIGLIIVVNGRKARLQQAYSALFGCGILFSVPLMFVMLIVLGNQDAEGVLPLLLLIATWGLIMWSVVVDGHIVSRTTDKPPIYGYLVAFSIFMLQLTLHAGLNASPGTGS